MVEVDICQKKDLKISGQGAPDRGYVWDRGQAVQVSGQTNQLHL